MTQENKKTLYLECATGISGDMTVAALLNLGADRAGLLRVLESLHVDGYEVEIAQTSRKGMAGCDFNVILKDKHSHEPHENHEHHEHDHGHHDHHDHEHPHHGHEHKHDEHTHHHHHEHEHRNLHDVLHIIERAEMSDRAKDIACRTFEIVAEAEAKAHGLPIDEVHFHEVGAIDSIVDIVSAAYCLDNLGVERVVVPHLNEGSGTIRCQHGILPVPVPAVANIAAAHGIRLRINDVNTEMVTPTGAAIVAAVRTDTALPETFVIDRVGIGLGKRDLGRPNFLRAMLISPDTKTESPSEEAPLAILESNIDDCTGEQLGLTMERLLAAGALDVHYIPCFMKKNRPGYLLRVICKAADIPKLEDTIFRNTTTIGVRRTPFERTSLRRERIDVALPEGTVAVKKCYWQDEIFYYPEFESVRALSESSGRRFADLYAEAQMRAREA